MDDLALIKEKAKQYIDNAGEKTVKMVFAMLQVDAESDWWDDVEDDVKASVQRGLKDARAGRITSHGEVMENIKNAIKVNWYNPQSKLLPVPVLC